jgi:hypothetical protein
MDSAIISAVTNASSLPPTIRTGPRYRLTPIPDIGDCADGIGLHKRTQTYEFRETRIVEAD